VSFVFLSHATDTVEREENQLSLIPFPIDDIFSRKLKNFDVIVLDDFSHRAYSIRFYLERSGIMCPTAAASPCRTAHARGSTAGGYGDSALREVLARRARRQGKLSSPRQRACGG